MSAGIVCDLPDGVEIRMALVEAEELLRLQRETCVLHDECRGGYQMLPSSGLQAHFIRLESKTAAAFLASKAAYGLDDRGLHIKLSTGVKT